MGYTHPPDDPTRNATIQSVVLCDFFCFRHSTHLPPPPPTRENTTSLHVTLSPPPPPAAGTTPKHSDFTQLPSFLPPAPAPPKYPQPGRTLQGNSVAPHAAHSMHLELSSSFTPISPPPPPPTHTQHTTHTHLTFHSLPTMCQTKKKSQRCCFFSHHLKFVLARVPYLFF